MSEERKIKMLQQIMKLSYSVNRDTKHDVRLDFQGNVNKLTFWIHENGYSDKKFNKAYDKRIEFYLEAGNAEDKLIAILAKLEELRA